ncbi:hypothetical protein BC629DRAFT_1540300, partial [Irpex lacteus]
MAIYLYVLPSYLWLILRVVHPIQSYGYSNYSGTSVTSKRGRLSSTTDSILREELRQLLFHLRDQESRYSWRRLCWLH